MRRLAAPLVLTAFALGLAAPAVAAPGLTVALDHSQRIRVSRPAGSVIVGNPNVADVTVVDPHTVFVSGRGYGVSEVVVLDPVGRTIWQGDVVVTAPAYGEVTVYRGAQATEMACAQVCSTSVRSGKGANGAAGAAGGLGAGGAGAGGGSTSTTTSSPVPAPQPSPATP
jgi:Flp pilus assembly secretin CpaC